MTEPTKDHNEKFEIIKAAIFDAAEKIASHKKTREAINAEIAAEIEKLEALGINRHAFRFAMKYLESNKVTREGFDIGYQLSREALGVALQADLFDDIDAVKAKHSGEDDAGED